MALAAGTHRTARSRRHRPAAWLLPLSGGRLAAHPRHSTGSSLERPSPKCALSLAVMIALGATVGLALGLAILAGLLAVYLSA